MIYIWQIYMTDYIWLLYNRFQTLEKVKESQNVKKWKWLCLYKNWLKHITDALVYTWPLLALHQLQVFLLRRLRELDPMQINVLGEKRNHLSEALPQSNLQWSFLVGPTHTKRNHPSTKKMVKEVINHHSYQPMLQQKEDKILLVLNDGVLQKCPVLTRRCYFKLKRRKQKRCWKLNVTSPICMKWLEAVWRTLPFRLPSWGAPAWFLSRGKRAPIPFQSPSRLETASTFQSQGRSWDLPYNLQCSANHAINLWPTQPTPDPEAF